MCVGEERAIVIIIAFLTVKYCAEWIKVWRRLRRSAGYRGQERGGGVISEVCVGEGGGS